VFPDAIASAEQLRLGNDQADASGAKVTRAVQETPHTVRALLIVDASDLWWS
jgi:hypothetical protein